MATKAAPASGSRGVYQPDSDVHITYEDQMKINTFAKYIAKIKDLNEDLVAKQNELKTLEEACEEIELFDEDEQIPYLIGEVFISHNLPKTQVRNDNNHKKAQMAGIHLMYYYCRNY